MDKPTENRNFDISRRNQVLFRHYQIMVKLLAEERTEHHTLEVFTTGTYQLLEMRRLYAKTYQKMGYRTLSNITKNN